MHTESSYQRQWPLTIAFCCIVAPTKGGETPIASMYAVSECIGDELMEKFETLGVEYVRHYHAGVDLPWQNVFQTDSRAVVEQYCNDNDVDCAWLEGGLLRTSNLAQGVATHPVSHRRMHFNQAHLFHVSSLGEARASAMLSVFGRDRLPRHARFGDGSEISIAELATVGDAFRQSTLLFRWQPGDVLLLDNMQYSHGRRSYPGERKVFAALMDSYPQASASMD